LYMYSWTPVTWPTMGPMSDGRVTGWSRQWSWKSGGGFPAKKLRTVVSLACMHDWGDARNPFHDKNSYFLEKDDSDISITIVGIILSWVKCILGTKYLPAEPTISDIQRQSWPWPRSADWILRLAFIFCCIHSWMVLHEWIKTYFLSVFCLITPKHLHLLITI
jgi:hypothetical protein